MAFYILAITRLNYIIPNAKIIVHHMSDDSEEAEPNIIPPGTSFVGPTTFDGDERRHHFK